MENSELHEIRKAFEKHSSEDSANFTIIKDHLLRVEKERDQRHDEIMRILQPIAESYRSASTLGKWLMAVAVFISILLGIIIGLKSFIK